MNTKTIVYWVAWVICAFIAVPLVFNHVSPYVAIALELVVIAHPIYVFINKQKQNENEKN